MCPLCTTENRLRTSTNQLQSLLSPLKFKNKGQQISPILKNKALKSFIIQSFGKLKELNAKHKILKINLKSRKSSKYQYKKLLFYLKVF